MLKDFKSFIMKGNVVDMAVGIIIGAAFGTIITSLVKDVIMPPIGMALGKIDFANLLIVLKQGSPASPYASLADAQKAGAVTINYGQFINTVIAFLIVALVIFFFIVRPIAESQGTGCRGPSRDEIMSVLLHPDTGESDQMPELHIRIEKII